MGSLPESLARGTPHMTRLPSTHLMQPLHTLATTAEATYLCRFCEQPIAAGTGVWAAPRLGAQAQRTGFPLRVFGTPERWHALCVPASYRLDERF